MKIKPVAKLLVTAIASAVIVPAMAASELLVEEIIVTAQKREASMQDVPVSMSALSGSTLRDIGAGRIEDFIGLVPNVSINFNDSIRATEISIRGIVSDANSVGIDQSVGVYVDGVYMARPTTINTGVYDIARVEVLRGPQGTIFGKNTIAGAMSFITAKPTQSPEFEVVGSFGNFNSQRLYMMGNLPLTDDTMAIRGSIQYDKRDGYLENSAGPDNNDADGLSGRISFSYSPSDTLEVIVRADAAKDRTNQGATEVLVPSPLFEGAPFNSPQDIDPWDRKIKDSESSFQDRDLWGTSMEINWEVGSNVFTSITAYRTFDWENFQTTDHTEFDIFGTGITEDEEQYSQEFRVASNSDSALQYVAGLYWFQQDMDAEATAWVGADAFAVFGLPLGSNPVPGFGYIDIFTSNESFAGFGQLTYQATESLKLIAGLRYTTEDKDIEQQLFGDPTGSFVPSTEFVKFDRSDDEWSPMAALQYAFSDDTMAYASYSSGFKAGGYNAFSFDLVQSDGSPAEFDPELVDSYEIGLKTTFGEGRYRLNAAVFYMDYQDLQVNQLIENAEGIIDFQTSNAATAESTGLEIEFAARLTQYLDFSLAYGYTDATYDSYPGATSGGDDYSGNSLTQSPENSASSSLQYMRPVFSSLNLMARAEYVYRDSQYSDPANTKAIEGDDYSLVNFRLGLSTQDERFGVNLWVRNAFDEEYAVVRGFGSGAFSPGATFQRVGAERTYGVELSYKLAN